MNAAGLISGTPTSLGTGKFQVKIIDSGLQEAECTQEVTIGLVPPPAGLDWDNLVWGPINIYQHTPTGTLSGASFSVQASGDGGGGTNDTADCTGTLLYNGPAANCNLHVNATNMISAVPGGAIFSIGVQSDVTWVLSETCKQLPTFGTHAPGTYDFPFTVPDTGGVPASITVLVSWQAGAFMIGAGSLNCSGHLT
jgi:hypothetical protein